MGSNSMGQPTPAGAPVRDAAAHARARAPNRHAQPPPRTHTTTHDLQREQPARAEDEIVLDQQLHAAADDAQRLHCAVAISKHE